MDPYVYPGTSVLRNLRGIRDAESLSQFEADATSRRLLQLARTPISLSFDIRHLQAIHHHIFQDVYQWAGEFRTVNIEKAESVFAFKEHIASYMTKTFGELEGELHLAGTDLNRFAQRGAYYLGEINAVHPFREGNGRAQREFIRELAVRNGYTLNWSAVSEEQMIEASRRSLLRDNTELENLLTITLRTEPV